MALAIKCIHNFQPHHSYVSTLPDITQKLKRDIDELKHWHLSSQVNSIWDHIPHGIIDKATDQWQTRLRTTCVKAKGRHFEHLLWSSHTTGSFQSHSHYREEDNISFRFLKWSWYTGCYIWNSEEGTGRGRSPHRLLLAVPNVTAHPINA